MDLTDLKQFESNLLWITLYFNLHVQKQQDTNDLEHTMMLLYIDGRTFQISHAPGNSNNFFLNEQMADNSNNI